MILLVYRAVIFFILSTAVIVVTGLENGVARTPPMGWLAWTKFMCRIDCKRFPGSCISEDLFTNMANILVEEGYRAAGYTQVNIDDCWAARGRDRATGRLLANDTRFPNGIKWLSHYMHSRGLRLGIYANYGRFTCMGFPGTPEEYFTTDAKTFHEWDVDMLKFDGCFNDPSTLDNAYPKMGDVLLKMGTNRQGSHLIYSCSWPYYIRTKAMAEPDYELVSKHCNLWRNFDDIQISYHSVARIIDFYDKHQDKLASFHGPGHWNDPDMIIVGNPELSTDQARVQMAIWCIWSAPLLMSNDLREVPKGHKEILLNPKLIAVDQDPLGIMGKLVKVVGAVKIYLKPVSPVLKDGEFTIYSYAFALYNTNPLNSAKITVTLGSDLKLDYAKGYDVEELFSGENLGKLFSQNSISVMINATSAVMYLARIAESRALFAQNSLFPPGDVVSANLQLCILIVFVLLATFYVCRNKRRVKSWFRYLF